VKSPGREHVRRVAGVLSAVFSRPALRRVQLAFAGFNAAEWGVWIAMLVFAYDQGGATAAGLVALVQLVPSGLYAPFAAALADRHPAGRVLTAGYLAQAVSMAATAAALLGGAPPLLAYALAAAASSATTITRPAQAVLVPSLVRSADELTSMNVVFGWTEAISLLLAPALTGLVLAVSGPGAVFAVMAVVALASAGLTRPLRGAPGAARDETDSSLAQAGAGARMVAREPAARILVGVLGTQFLMIGALDVLFVVLAVDVLEIGSAGAGYLNAAFGAGGVIGIAGTVALVGRSRLAPPVAAAALIWSLALLGLAVWTSVFAAFALFVLAGSARTVLDVAARTLLQRTAATDVLARVFGLLETLDSIGLAAGALLAPLLVALLGAQLAIAGLALVLLLLLLLVGGRLRTIDQCADVPVVEVALLRSLAVFEPLSAAALEGLARRLTPIPVRAGQRVTEEGQLGRRYYVVAHGDLEVTKASGRVATLSRGDGIGEMSLLAGVPYAATVTARGAGLLYALDAEPFNEVMNDHAVSARALAADRVAPAGEPAPA
jgi:MFS family permease